MGESEKVLSAIGYKKQLKPCHTHHLPNVQTIVGIACLEGWLPKGCIYI